MGMLGTSLNEKTNLGSSLGLMRYICVVLSHSYAIVYCPGKGLTSSNTIDTLCADLAEAMTQRSEVISKYKCILCHHQYAGNEGGSRFKTYRART
jgi:hypothetical protein